MAFFLSLLDFLFLFIVATTSGGDSPSPPPPLSPISLITSRSSIGPSGSTTAATVTASSSAGVAYPMGPSTDVLIVLMYRGHRAPLPYLPQCSLSFPRVLMKLEHQCLYLPPRASFPSPTSTMMMTRKRKTPQTRKKLTKKKKKKKKEHWQRRKEEKKEATRKALRFSTYTSLDYRPYDGWCSDSDEQNLSGYNSDMWKLPSL